MKITKKNVTKEELEELDCEVFSKLKDELYEYTPMWAPYSLLPSRSQVISARKAILDKMNISQYVRRILVERASVEEVYGYFNMFDQVADQMDGDEVIGHRD